MRLALHHMGTPSADRVEAAKRMTGACAPALHCRPGASRVQVGVAARDWSRCMCPCVPRRQGARRGQVEVAKHMSRGLLALVPIFAGCSSPFLDSLSVLLQEARARPCPPRGALGARPVAARAGVRRRCVADSPSLTQDDPMPSAPVLRLCVRAYTRHHPIVSSRAAMEAATGQYWGRQGTEAPTQARRIDAGARRGGAQAALPPDPALHPESATPRRWRCCLMWRCSLNLHAGRWRCRRTRRCSEWATRRASCSLWRAAPSTWTLSAAAVWSPRPRARSGRRARRRGVPRARRPVPARYNTRPQAVSLRPSELAHRRSAGSASTLLLATGSTHGGVAPTGTSCQADFCRSGR